jgi:hypothetical protein
MTKPSHLKNSATAKSAAEKILATVIYNNGFHFFTSVGQYTGETAISLATFAKEIEVTPIESIDFHFKKADFQKWITETIGDAELGKSIGNIEKELNGEPLRKRILKTLNERVSELEIQIQHVSTPGSKK